MIFGTYILTDLNYVCDLDCSSLNKENEGEDDSQSDNKSERRINHTSTTYFDYALNDLPSVEQPFKNIITDIANITDSE